MGEGELEGLTLFQIQLCCRLSRKRVTSADKTIINKNQNINKLDLSVR